MRQWEPKHKSEILSKAVFVSGLAFYALVAIWLVFHLPDDAPYGGPDEPMHRSVSQYLAQHLAWPGWDSEELERYVNGVSYATGSSFGYWLEALLLRSSGQPRLSGLLLFFSYLLILGFLFRRDPLVGLLGMAALLPQVLFVFTYVNSDAWSMAIAFLLGLAISEFRANPTRRRSIVLLFTAAGACISCRQHTWVIGFAGFAYALLPHLRRLVREHSRWLIVASCAALVVASWWPVTSYFANDGDPVGFTAGRAAMARFGDPETSKELGSFGELPLLVFAVKTAESFYGRWGWMNVRLDTAYYAVAALVGCAFLWFLLTSRRSWAWLLFLTFGVNLALLLVYSIFYEVQAQGRYFFPAYFLVLGALLREAWEHPECIVPKKPRRVLVAWLSFLIALNAVASFTLTSRVMAAERSATPFLRGYAIFLRGDYEKARGHYQEAIREVPSDARGFLGLAFVDIKQRRLAQAEVNLRKYLELAPEDQKVRDLLRSIVSEQRRAKRAAPR
jgi:hypothetical protein